MNNDAGLNTNNNLYTNISNVTFSNDVTDVTKIPLTPYDLFDDSLFKPKKEGVEVPNEIVGYIQIDDQYKDYLDEIKDVIDDYTDRYDAYKQRYKELKERQETDGFSTKDIKMCTCDYCGAIILYTLKDLEVEEVVTHSKFVSNSYNYRQERDNKGDTFFDNDVAVKAIKDKGNFEVASRIFQDDIIEFRKINCPYCLNKNGVNWFSYKRNRREKVGK